MKKILQRTTTSLLLIVIVAMGARVGFAWNQARKIAPGVLGVVPFQQETGNIAFALAEGRGFRRQRHVREDARKRAEHRHR